VGGGGVAQARVSAGRARTLTDSLGHFSLTSVPAAPFRLRVERGGYATLDSTVAASGALVLTLTPRPEALPSVQGTAPGGGYVSPRMEGFEFRRTHHNGSGRFITRADLERDQYSTLANVLRRLPGAMVVHGGAAMEDYLATGQSPGPHALSHPPAPCYAQIFVNGVQVYGMDRGDSPPNLNEFSLNELEAVEYYAQPASTPAEFRTMNADCGTLILWTRFAR
jgi:hypothetical protein